jgi:broad specificity phosphatase PhoE
MSVLEVRRHAARGVATPLSAAGERAAAALAGPVYALVVSSPLPRAKRTAELIAGRLDRIEAGLLPDIGGAEVFGSLPELADWRALLAREPRARAFADEQLRTWSSLVAAVGPRDRVLAVSHSGIIELPAVALAEQLGTRLEGPAFGTLDGVRIEYGSGGPARIELLRAP